MKNTILKKTIQTTSITRGCVVFILFLLVLVSVFSVKSFFDVFSGRSYLEDVFLKKSLINLSSKDYYNASDKTGSQISVVSVTKDDLDSSLIKKSKYLMDASIDEYLNVLRKILSKKPFGVFISVLPPSFDTQDLSKLDDLIDESVEYKNKIFILGSFSKIWPYSFYKQDVLSDFLCSQGVQLKCRSLNIKNWSVNKLADIYGYNFRDNSSFVLDLRDRSVLEKKVKFYSFSDIVSDAGETEFKDKLVFIGNDIIQKELKYEKDPYVLKRVKEVGDENSSLYLATSRHVFLAQLAYMFESGHYVADFNWQHILSFCLLVLILVLCLRQKFLYVLLILGSVGYLIPFINSFFIDRFKINLSMGEGFFYSCILFLVVGSSYYLYFSIKNVSLKQKLQVAKNIQELKTNFISLVSHNLNTPISGLYSLYNLYLLSGRASAKLGPAIAWMLFTVKYALGVRLVGDDLRFNLRKYMSCLEIKKSFKDNMIPILSLIEVGNIKVAGSDSQTSEDGTDNFEHSRLYCNEGACNLFISSIICLLKIKEDLKEGLSIDIKSWNRQTGLSGIEISFTFNKTIKTDMNKLLDLDLDQSKKDNNRTVASFMLEDQSGSDFRVLERLILEFIEEFKSRYTLSLKQKDSYLYLGIYPSK